MKENILAPAFTVLDRLMKIVIRTTFDGQNVGDIALVIHRKRGAYGYCNVKENWEINGVPAREIALTPDCLTEGVDRIITTMMHELVHACNANNGVKDASGKKHNKKFKQMCDTVGLYCVPHEKYGFSTPCDNLPAENKAKLDAISAELTDDEKKILESLKTIIEEKETKKKDRNLLVYVCPKCGQKIRAKKEINIICGVCLEQFIEKSIEGGD